LGFAAATNWQQLWLPMILYATFFESPAIYVYLLKSCPGKVMQAFGMFIALTALGQVSSPFIGGIIVSLIGKQATFLIASVFFGAAVLPILFIKRLPKQKIEKSILQVESQPKPVRPIKPLLLCGYFSFVMFFVFLLEPLISQFTNGVYQQSMFSLGVFGAASAMGCVFFSIAFGKIGDKHSKFTAATGSILVSGFAFLIMILFNNFATLCAASFLSGASITIMFFSSGIIGAAAPQRSTGKWVAVGQASITFTGLAAPILGGILYETSPYLAFSVSIAALFLAATPGLIVILRRSRNGTLKR